MAKVFRDQFGFPVVAGRRYAVGPRRSGGVPCTVFLDESADELMMCRVHGDRRPQRVEDVDHAAHFILIDDDDVELLESPDDSSIEDYVDRAVSRARGLRDQLDAIESDLIDQLDAFGNQLLLDEIASLVHGDGRRDVVVDLANKLSQPA
jgi:hypothetical protein